MERRRKMNRAQRRRLNSKRKGATQMHHRTMTKKIQAETEEENYNGTFFNKKSKTTD